MSIKKTALVTGANRGIGFEVSHELAKLGIHVILTSRNKTKGLIASQKLQEEGFDVAFHQLDVTDHLSIQVITEHIKKEYSNLDILINNAGIALDKKDSETATIFKARLDTIKNTMETNVYGPLLLCQMLIPIMKKNSYGRIVNVSSGMGQLSDMNGGYVGYRFSKVSLNALTKILSNELQGTNILVNSVCPGWVRTDMGGPNAAKSPEEGAETIVWLATLPDNGPSGGFFRDKKQIPW